MTTDLQGVVEAGDEGAGVCKGKQGVTVAVSMYGGPLFVEKEPEAVGARVRRVLRSACSTAAIRRKLPFLTWLPRYSLAWLVGDFLAGITVGLTAIPQGIANAGVAGLPPQYGLYSGFFGAFIYIIFGSCKDLTIGPTSILALMCQSAVEKGGPAFAVFLCFLSGCMILLLGLLNLGFLVTFISVPVTSGFTTAAAITIASTQIKPLLGISGKSSEFLESWRGVIKDIGQTRLWDSVLGVSTIIVLVLGKAIMKLQIKGGNLTKNQLIYNKTIWIISIGRNAIVAVVGTALAYTFHEAGKSPFKITGPIVEGIPALELPPFSTVLNGTEYGFTDIINEVGLSLITVPFISILEAVAIAKAFSKGKVLDATQEMIALGMCNIAGSFSQSMPTTGSFTRSAVNNASGVFTPFGGLFTGGLVLLTLAFLTSTFQYIPKASLSGIIIAAMFYMVEYEMFPLLWKTRKVDLIPFIITMVSCLFVGLEYGIIIGIGLNILFILFDAARPRISIQHLKMSSHEVLVVATDYSIVFPAAEYIQKKIIKNCTELEGKVVVVLDGQLMRHIDTTVAKNMYSLLEDLKVRDQQLLFWNWNKSSRHTLAGFNPKFRSLFRNEATLEEIFEEKSVVQKGDLTSGENGLDLVKIT